MKYICWFVRHLDEYAEKYVIVMSYACMATIIFVEVIRRFVFSQQVPWSTTIPILLFLWLTWFGAAYNIKIRRHLALSEVRARLPYTWQFVCFVADAVLWIVFAAIVIYFSYFQVYLSYENFAIVEGTDNIMQWWFYMATPLAWCLVIIRVIQKLVEDIRLYRTGKPFFSYYDQ